MRYKLNGGITIRSENAAKPLAQASKYLCRYIEALPPVGASFDYGAGKLRYLNPILTTTETLTLVDSEIQLSRTQKIHRKVTSVRDVVQASNHLAALNTQGFFATPQAFERGFCINVLSVVPTYTTREKIMLLLRSKLIDGGTCLFVVQYRNSDFTRMQAMNNSKKWRDGFLIDSFRGHSFYGLIQPTILTRMALKAGFEIVSETLDEGRVYLLVRSPRRLSRRVIGSITEGDNFHIRLAG